MRTHRVLVEIISLLVLNFGVESLSEAVSEQSFIRNIASQVGVKTREGHQYRHDTALHQARSADSPSYNQSYRPGIKVMREITPFGNIIGGRYADGDSHSDRRRADATVLIRRYVDGEGGSAQTGDHNRAPSHLQLFLNNRASSHSQQIRHQSNRDLEELAKAVFPTGADINDEMKDQTPNVAGTTTAPVAGTTGGAATTTAGAGGVTTTGASVASTSVDAATASPEAETSSFETVITNVLLVAIFACVGACMFRCYSLLRNGSDTQDGQAVQSTRSTSGSELRRASRSRRKSADPKADAEGSDVGRASSRSRSRYANDDATGEKSAEVSRGGKRSDAESSDQPSARRSLSRSRYDRGGNR